MKILGYALIVLGVMLAAGGLVAANRPSVSPMATVIGAFALPGLCIWAGVTLIRRG